MGHWRTRIAGVFRGISRAWSQVFAIDDEPSFDHVLRKAIQGQDRVSLRVAAVERQLGSSLSLSTVNGATNSATPKRSQE